MKNNISMKFILPISIALLIISVFLTIFISNSKIRSLNESVKSNIQSSRREVLVGFDLVYKNILKQVKSSMDLFKDKSLDIGRPQLNGYDKIERREVPKLMFGSQNQVMNFQLVDYFKKYFACTATLFVKDGNDFIRVSTNVMKNNGDRAVGTVLSPESQAYKNIMNKQAYYGMVDILGKKYITGYEPILDRENNLVGVWYIGYKIDEIEQLSREVKNISVLDHGFVFVTDSKGTVLLESNNTNSELLKSININTYNKDL